MSASSAPLTSGDSVHPRMGWEVFESPIAKGTVADLNTVDEDSRKQAFSAVENPNEPEKDETPREKADDEADSHKIASMFQATRPNTSSGASSGASCNPPIPRPFTSSIRRPRAATALPRIGRQTEPELQKGAIMTAIFSIEKISYDVHMYEDRITWVPVSQSQAKKPSTRQDSHHNLPLTERGMVYLHEICSVRLKTLRNMRAGTVTTIGFGIFTALTRNGNKLREHSAIFMCFSRDICVQWASKIKSIIVARPERPKHLLVVLPQSITTRQLWDDIIEAKLQMAGIKGKYAEIHKSNSVSEYVEKAIAEKSISPDSEPYDGIIVIGKMAFFSEVLNCILRFKKNILKSGTWHPQIPVLGYVPVSSFSSAARELHGCSDVETAIFHSIYGCTRSIPVCSFFDKNGEFLRHGLLASYGFSGGDTSRENSSKGFIQGSIRKGFAITKAIVQRKSYPCEIHYKDCPGTYEPFDDDELFAEEEFSKFSMVNQHYVDDDNVEDAFDRSTPTQATSDADSGVWPQFDKWDTVPRRNYLDISVTSLPQTSMHEIQDPCPLSAILVRETMSRKELLMGMGSQVSISSTLSKTKPEILDKTDVIRGSEFIVKPHGNAGAANVNCLSKWTVDDICLDPQVQELHVKVDEYPLLMYGRIPDQPLSTPPKHSILKLDVDCSNIDSMA